LHHLCIRKITPVQFVLSGVVFIAGSMELLISATGNERNKIKILLRSQFEFGAISALG
jgi:hypothetical protein